MQCEGVYVHSGKQLQYLQLCACGVCPCRSLVGRCARLNSLSSTTRLTQRSTRGLCELLWIHQGCMHILMHNQVSLLGWHSNEGDEKNNEIEKLKERLSASQ